MSRPLFSAQEKGNLVVLFIGAVLIGGLIGMMRLVAETPTRAIPTEATPVAPMVTVTRTTPPALVGTTAARILVMATPTTTRHGMAITRTTVVRVALCADDTPIGTTTAVTSPPTDTGTPVRPTTTTSPPPAPPIVTTARPVPTTTTAVHPAPATGCQR